MIPTLHHWSGLWLVLGHRHISNKWESEVFEKAELVYYESLDSTWKDWYQEEIGLLVGRHDTV